ncbi:plastocyanin/azurin family copper-binding protein [Novosphingobium aerophilum]|uniref:cupredoxin domain-containing protein n=1 Tax=Novosphingobium TaxID=165696 RepID=UPI0010492306|nr:MULTISPECIES: cupredoxin domain-containing protein [unclassified Novosphingobium]TCM41437.1 cupredoxin-like protein [Novosphingobium sp. ST904]WRT95410.1 cupredoxin domain-containing protein [Novosphingobium sp. RL4]
MNTCRLVIAAAVLAAPLPAASQQPGGTAPAEMRVLTVRLSNFQFDPATITLEHGASYDLKLVNTASGGHDFAAKEFFSAARIAEADRAKVSDGQVPLAAGQTVEIHLVAPQPGSYKLRCTHFMHSAFGMNGKIVVQ